MEHYNKMMEYLNELWNEHDGTHFYKDEFKDFLHQTLLSWHKSEVLRLEGTKKDIFEEAQKGIEATQSTAGYNLSLSDSIAYHQEIISKLENI